MRSRSIIVVIAAVALLMASLATVAAAFSQEPEVSKQLAAARNATARYHDVREAEADGYIAVSPCVSSPAGGMGVHYMKPSLLDRTLDVEQPEILVYEPRGGGLKLVAVEYMIPTLDQSLPPVADPVHPELFGHRFDGPMAGHGPGAPAHYDLHAWVWQPNRNGMFAEWNPNVHCPAA